MAGSIWGARAGAGSAGPPGPRSCRPTGPGASRSRDCRLGTGARVLLERILAPVTDLKGGLLPAVLELCSANLLLEQRQLSEPTYRFRHSLIQDAIYKGLLKQQRRHLHARATSGLEAASPVPEEIAGLLGRHYAVAGEVDRAVHYLELAGDAAAATYANDEAIASYRLALELFSEEPGLASEAVSLWLKLGALFWRLGDYSEGRAALGEAAARSPAGAPLLEARCYRWLGQLEIEDCRDEDAFAALDKAEEVLQACSDKNSDAWVENWLDLQLSRSNLHYWRNETERQGQVLERALAPSSKRAPGRGKRPTLTCMWPGTGGGPEGSQSTTRRSKT